MTQDDFSEQLGKRGSPVLLFNFALIGSALLACVRSLCTMCIVIFASCTLAHISLILVHVLTLHCGLIRPCSFLLLLGILAGEICPLTCLPRRF